MTRTAVFVVSIPVPCEGGLSSNILNRKRILEKANAVTIIISASTIPTPIRFMLLDYPCLMLSKILGFGAATYRFNVLMRLLRILTRKAVSARAKVVVFAHDVLAFNAIYPLCKMGCKSVLFIHDYYAPTIAGHGGISERGFEFSYLRKMERRAYNLASEIFCVDSRIRRYVVTLRDGNQSKVEILKNSPDCELFGSEPRTYLGNTHRGNQDSFVVLVPRRLYPKNGVRYVIEALADPQLKQMPIHVIVAGSGPLLTQLMDLANHLGVASRIRFAGSVPHQQMPEYYSAVDAVVIPSVTHLGVQEATSLSALEAMASGKPVVASSIGGLQEIIEHGKNGLLVPERNPSELARALLRIWKSRSLAESLGVEGRTAAVQRENEFSTVLETIMREER